MRLPDGRRKTIAWQVVGVSEEEHGRWELRGLDVCPRSVMAALFWCDLVVGFAIKGRGQNEVCLRIETKRMHASE